MGTDKINKNNIATQIRTKTINICAMPIYEKKSMEVGKIIYLKIYMKRI